MNSSVRRAIAKQMWKTIISACFGLTLSNCMENSELPVHPQESSIKRGATQIVCNEHSHEDVKEALFRYLIAKMGDLTCCLAVENGDPSDEFMKRFANIGVLRASECNWKGEGIIKDKNGEYGVALGISKIIEITRRTTRCTGRIPLLAMSCRLQLANNEWWKGWVKIS
jgi:hypothetical protein